MSELEADFDEEITERKPRRARKRSEERSVVFYLTENGNPKKIGNFPESFIGTPLERRIPIFAQEIFGQKIYGMAEMKADIRKANGVFEKSFDFSISEPEKQTIAEADAPDLPEENEGDFEFETGEQSLMTMQLQIENRNLRIEI